MILRSLRHEFFVVFLALSLLPAVPLIFTVQWALKQQLEIPVGNAVTEVIEDAGWLSELAIQEQRRKAIERTFTLAVHSDFRRWADRALDHPSGASPAGVPPYEESGIGGLALLSPGGEVLYSRTTQPGIDLASALLDTTTVRAPLQTGQSRSDYIDDRHTIVVAVPFSVAAGRSGALVTATLLPADLRGRADRIRAVAVALQTTGGERQRIHGTVLRYILLCYLAAALLGLAATMWITHRTVSPLTELAFAMEQVIGGNLEYQTHLKARNDEIGNLVGLFNRMAQSIRQHQSRLLFLEKMAAWREIAQRMAHEIKNPLTPIQLTIQQLQDSYATNDDEFKRLLDSACEIIQEEIESLSTLTKEFSDFARLPSLTFRPTNLDQLIEETVRLYPHAPVQVELAGGLPDLSLDREAVRRVLMNLVENALQAIHDRTDGAVQIRTVLEEGLIRLVIRDNGHGIRKDWLPRVFEPHFSTKTTGMGLGLAIAKTIVEEHGARINVDSIENLGTSFIIEFPINQHHPL
jgi:nitrogen fixation/metabolism regulation signal transduction histidine kinase